MEKFEHILDKPAWNSLTSRHADLAISEGGARRYLSDIGPLGDLAGRDSASLDDLAALVRKTGPVAVAQPAPVDCPEGLTIRHGFLVHQMLLTDPGVGREDDALVRLGEPDATEMLALATDTHPGPFGTDTQRLGEYWGFKVDGRLVAMAGERMKPAGYTEISGVCTAPDHRGKGYANRLVRHLCARIAAAGDMPFLHVETTKPEVEAIYRKMGFETRQTLAVRLFGCA